MGESIERAQPVVLDTELLILMTQAITENQVELTPVVDAPYTLARDRQSGELHPVFFGSSEAVRQANEQVANGEFTIPRQR